MEPFQAITERELTRDRPAGGTITSVAIVQQVDSSWFVCVSLSWRTNHMFNVCRANKSDVKVFVRLSSAARRVTGKYGFIGAITMFPRAELASKAAF